MRELLRKIHGWPEEIRKLLAGVLIVVVALFFFSAWGSFVSSRLVALGPANRVPVQQSPPPVSGVVRLSPSGGSRFPSQSVQTESPSPARGLAETVSGVRRIGPTNPGGTFRRLFGAIGDAVAGGIEFLYLKLSRYVPPNL